MNPDNDSLGANNSIGNPHELSREDSTSGFDSIPMPQDSLSGFDSMSGFDSLLGSE